MSSYTHMAISLAFATAITWGILPLSFRRCMFVAALVGMYAGYSASVEAAPADERCSTAATLAVGALEARQAGITEEVAMEYLRHQGVYSGLPVWAVKQAYDAPADVPAWMLRGAVFGECLEREK